MNLNKIFLTAAAAIGLLFAVLLGSYLAEGKHVQVGLFLGFAILSLAALILRTNCWIFIPLCSGLSGTIAAGRFPASVAEISVAFCFGLFLVFKALKVIPKFPTHNICDKLLIANLIYILTVFARNPVGLDFIKSDLIGGRPYFAILLACCGFWVLQHATITTRLAQALPFLMCFGATVNALSGLVGYFLPGFGHRLSILYSGFNPGNELNPYDAPGDRRVERHGYLAGFGVEVGRAAVACGNIFKIILFQNFFLSLLFYSSLCAILFSGFRSNLISWIFAVALATYIRGGIRYLFTLSIAGIAGIVIVVTFHTAGFHVPLAAQRALSFIPIGWDYRATEDARGTVEWRLEMWRLALTTNQYIKNKTLGDGFGFNPSELRGWTTLSAARIDTSFALQDYFLVTGDYHSGPISAVRFVGFLGLFLFSALMISTARHAWKTINHAKRTPFFNIALFSGIVAIYQPFGFYLIFGGYGYDFVQSIFNLGMLNLINRSIDNYIQKNKSLSKSINH